jgi:hypothetical protein
MLSITLLLALAASEPNTIPGNSVLGGATFEKLVIASRAECPSVRVANLTPAGLLDIEETFRDRLSTRQRVKLDAAVPRTADDGIAECADMNGASCDANAYLRGFEKAGLMPVFLKTICTPDVVR